MIKYLSQYTAACWLFGNAFSECCIQQHSGDYNSYHYFMYSVYLIRVKMSWNSQMYDPYLSTVKNKLTETSICLAFKLLDYTHIFIYGHCLHGIEM